MRERTINIDKRKWETPQSFFDRLNAVYHFTLDVCAEPSTAKCDRYFTKEDDALTQTWGQENCWMNPEYGNPEYPCKEKCKKKRCIERGFHIDTYLPGVEDWVKKAWLESMAGSLVVGLLPASTGPQWFHNYVMKAETLILVEGRLRFLYEGEELGSPDFDSIVAVWTPEYSATGKSIPSTLLSMRAYL